MNSETKIFKPKVIERLIDSKETKDIIKCILKVELQTIPIGEGGNAFIYIPTEETFANICIKKSKEKPQIIYNTIDQEHEFQKEIKGLGINTPATLLSFINEDDGLSYFVMERIKGHTVREVIQDETLLPENFNYEKFCNSLNEQISKMHKAGIFHRDLHSDNVMINENGSPVIIDFGTATKGSGSDFTYEESVEMFDKEKGRYNMVNGYFKDDLEMVRNIKDSLKKFMKI